MDNITVVFCEGQHDIAFLSKILYVHGYKEYKEKLKVFKEPLGEQYLSILREEKNISEKKLGFNPIYKIPSVALSKDNELVLFHNMGGDGRKSERSKLLEMYKNLQGDDDFSESNLNYKFLYFFDADENPKEERIQSLNDELDLALEDNIILEHNGCKWGCYVFHKDKNGGYLEDVLLDLMKPTNETIFKNTEAFISANILTPIKRQSEYKPFSGIYNNKCKFKDIKSIISIAGQLQFSGMSNAVIIGKSDYITKSDIENNEVCKDIINLFG